MRRRLAIAALALAVAGGGCSEGGAGDATDAVADGRTPTVRPQLRGDTDAVLVIGDSLTNGARLFGDLGDRLAHAGFDELEIIAEDARDVGWGLEQIAARPTVPALVVVELGTNPDADPDGFDGAVAEIVDALRDRGAEHIAWVAPAHARDDRYLAKAEILAGNPGIDHVADWASVVQSDPRRLAADGVHPTREGYSDLAGFLVDTAAGLAAASD